MRILLISIINSYKYGNTGVDSIVARLRKNEGNIVDVRYYHNKESLSDIENDLRNTEKYEIYGFSVFETNYYLFKDIAKYIKSDNQLSVTVMGGQFVSMNYEEILVDNEYIDYCIIGDGETPFERLVDFYSTIRGNRKLMGDINIASKTDFVNKQLNTESEAFRPVVYDYFINDTKEKNHEKTYCMLTKSNVCTGNCSFCVSRKGKIKYRSPESLVENVEYLAKKYDIRKFFLCDDDIFDIDGEENRKRMYHFIELIDDLKLNITFSGFAKAKAISNTQNKDLLEKMNQIGFHHLFVGIDAGNESDRKLYNKRSTLEEGVTAINLLKDIGISPRYGMIFVNPFSTLDTFEENYKYLVRLRSSNYYHYGGLKVQLLKGTKLLQMTREANLLRPGYSFMNTGDYFFNDEKVQKIVDFLDKEFYPRIDRLRYQFNTLKRKFELVKHINPKAYKFSKIIDEYECIESECLKEYFGYLYVVRDIDYCRNNLIQIEEEMRRRTEVYRPIINELEYIYRDTPLER